MSGMNASLGMGRIGDPDEPRHEREGVCPTCHAPLQRITLRGRPYARCPWTKASEQPPEEGDVWACSWPRGRVEDWTAIYAREQRIEDERAERERIQNANTIVRRAYAAADPVELGA